MAWNGVAKFAVVVLLVLGTVVIPSSTASGHTGASGSAAATGSIQVAATKDYGYQPGTFQQVPTNATITVTFTDDDVLQHSFVIASREGFVIPTGDTDTQLAQFFATYPALYYSVVNALGDQAVGTFHSPSAPGWYEFVCNVSGHFENGMYGFVAFGENLPSNLTPPSRVGVGGSNLSPLDEAAIAGFVVALALVIVVWRRHRTAPKVPP
ncbi:MAG: sulfocyanin-like copper-binding protein [Thermoplasmata archaeon]